MPSAASASPKLRSSLQCPVDKISPVSISPPVSIPLPVSSLAAVSSSAPVSSASPVSSAGSAPESSSGGSPGSSTGSSVSLSVGTQTPSTAAVPGPHSSPVGTSFVSASHANKVEAMSEIESVRVMVAPWGKLAVSADKSAIFPSAVTPWQFEFCELSAESSVRV